MDTPLNSTLQVAGSTPTVAGPRGQWTFGTQTNTLHISLPGHHPGMTSGSSASVCLEEIDAAVEFQKEKLLRKSFGYSRGHTLTFLSPIQ